MDRWTNVDIFLRQDTIYRVQGPVHARHLTAATRLKDVLWDTDGETLVWLEGRGADNGIVCQRERDRPPRNLTSGCTVRARVSYGGGEFTVSHGRVSFVESGNRICVVEIDGDDGVHPLTVASGYPSSPAASRDGRWLIYVHSDGEIDCLAICGTSRADGDDPHPLQRLTTGADFYMQPVWHPHDLVVAWIEWDQPQMPWDGTRLVLGRLSQAAGEPPVLDSVSEIAGGANVAVFQPAFSPDGRFLSYVTDESGWGRLRLYDLEAGASGDDLVRGEGDIGQPAWVQGLRTCSWSPDSKRIYFTRARQGFRKAFCLDLQTEAVTPLEALLEFSDVAQICASAAGEIACIASSGRVPTRLFSATDSGARITRARSCSEEIDSSSLSQPAPVSWSNSDGIQIHGLYYAAVGDVEDVMSGARHVVECGLADPHRLVVLGGSSGGYTVLRALSLYPGFFRAGVCRYGLSDLLALAMQSHKFEARYFDSLLSALPAGADLYRQRSPLFAADRLVDPVILFQETDDEIVPRTQSDAIVDSLRRRGVPHEYRVFEGEGHGFRKPETVEAYIEAVESFLERHVLTDPG